MFARDQPAIAFWAHQRPQNVTDVLMFVRLTVRRKLDQVPQVMRDFRGRPRHFPQRVDLQAYQDAVTVGAFLHQEQYALSSREVFDAVLTVHGLGIVKAGFVVQLLRGDMGCLDTHNLTRFGIDPRTFRADGSYRDVQRRIAFYIHLCRTLGGAEYLWDSWCHYVAALYPYVYKSGDAVSALHRRILIGR